MEEARKFPAAEAAYKQALQQAAKDERAANRYRIALARVLWKRHLDESSTTPLKLGRLGTGNDAVALMLLLVAADTGTSPQLREAAELAKQVLASPAEQTSPLERARRVRHSRPVDEGPHALRPGVA